jgi:hypothetical protein
MTLNPSSSVRGVLKSGAGGTLRVGGSTQHIENLFADFVPRYRRGHPSVESCG